MLQSYSISNENSKKLENTCNSSFNISISKDKENDTSNPLNPKKEKLLKKKYNKRVHIIRKHKNFLRTVFSSKRKKNSK